MTLLETLEYDHETGSFVWKVSNKRRAVQGAPAGWLGQRDGYIRIQVDGRSYLAHRLAWLFVYGQFPEGCLDHKNRNRQDNRIDNLRLASKAQNTQNSKVRSDCLSGLKGTRFHTSQKQWEARITIDHKLHSLGFFATKEAAYEAYRITARVHFGEFANTGEMS